LSRHLLYSAVARREFCLAVGESDALQVKDGGGTGQERRKTPGLFVEGSGCEVAGHWPALGRCSQMVSYWLKCARNILDRLSPIRGRKVASFLLWDFALRAIWRQQYGISALNTS